MSQTFEVLAVEKLKDGQSVKGPFTVWKLGLKNGTNEALIAELFCPGGVSPPAVGSQVEGDIEKTDNPSWLDKFKPLRRGGGFRPEDPERQKRIVRQHSQSMALQAIKLAVDMHLLKVVDPERPGDSGGEPETTAELFALIAKTADWFDKDVESAAS